MEKSVELIVLCAKDLGLTKSNKGFCSDQVMLMVKLIAWFMGWDQWAESKCCSSGGWNNSACSLGRLHGCTWCPQTCSLHIQDMWLEPFWVCWQMISTTSCPLMHTCEHTISRSCIVHHTSISLYNVCCCIWPFDCFGSNTYYCLSSLEYFFAR